MKTNPFLIETLQAIHAYNTANDGDAPTVRELCAALGGKSTSVVEYRLRKLVTMRWITRKPQKARTIRLTTAGLAALKGGS